MSLKSRPPLVVAERFYKLLSILLQSKYYQESSHSEISLVYYSSTRFTFHILYTTSDFLPCSTTVEPIQRDRKSQDIGRMGTYNVLPLLWLIWYISYSMRGMANRDHRHLQTLFTSGMNCWNSSSLHEIRIQKNSTQSRGTRGGLEKKLWQLHTPGAIRYLPPTCLPVVSMIKCQSFIFDAG